MRTAHCSRIYITLIAITTVLRCYSIVKIVASACMSMKPREACARIRRPCLTFCQQAVAPGLPGVAPLRCLDHLRASGPIELQHDPKLQQQTVGMAGCELDTWLALGWIVAWTAAARSRWYFIVGRRTLLQSSESPNKHWSWPCSVS